MNVHVYTYSGLVKRFTCMMVRVLPVGILPEVDRRSSLTWTTRVTWAPKEDAISSPHLFDWTDDWRRRRTQVTDGDETGSHNRAQGLADESSPSSSTSPALSLSPLSVSSTSIVAAAAAATAAATAVNANVRNHWLLRCVAAGDDSIGLPPHAGRIIGAVQLQPGRDLFAKAMQGGWLDGSYWSLAENYSTQTDPSYCSLTTLSMVLNSLDVDPQRRAWPDHAVHGEKIPWRWFTEESLVSCCGRHKSLREYRENDVRRAGGARGLQQCLCATNRQCRWRPRGWQCWQCWQWGRSARSLPARSARRVQRARGRGRRGRSCSPKRARFCSRRAAGTFPIGAWEPESDMALVMDGRPSIQPF